MATYNYTADTLKLDELVLYGSSRLGTISPNLQVYPPLQADSDDLATLGLSYSMTKPKFPFFK